MTRDAIWPFAIGALALAAIGLGLFVVGGPGTGQAEQRDQTRMDQVRKAAAHIRCLARQNNDQLPEVPAPHTRCPEPETLNDPFSGNPFRYEKLDEDSWLLCPQLELPDRAVSRSYPYWGSYQQATGCVEFKLDP